MSKKATVLVRLKSEVLDPQGDAVKRAHVRQGFSGVKSVRIGKLIEIELEDGAVSASLAENLRKMSDELLANPVIEDYEVTV